MIGEKTLDDLAVRTGMSRDRLLEVLERKLPAIMDRFAPRGPAARRDGHRAAGPDHR
ncbi:MAG: hypothetical protein HC844_02335 [Tabrizicola sp.]|nr:hypothetical protein [Tabrizicola sp.]